MSAIPAELGTEWSLLLTACSVLPANKAEGRMQSLLSAPLDWQRLFSLAEQHGVQPLLHQALHPVQDDIPAELRNALEQSYQTNLHKSLLLSRELIRVVYRLTGAGLDVIPYKGPALAEFLYGDIALRQSGDIDLLVRRKDFSRVQDVLAKMGYVTQTSLSEAEQAAYLKSGYECAFDGPTGPNALEVQWAIQPRFYAIDVDMDGIFDRSVKVTVAGQEMKSPSPADLFLILAVHAAKHIWGRLIWICDLARLMHSPSLDWGAIARRAKALGLLRIVNISMLLANRMLGEPIPRGARNNISDEEIDLQLSSQIQRQILGESTFSVDSLPYFRLMMRLRERPSDRLRLVARLAFTPGPGEWKAVRLPPHLFPLYRIVRLSRLLARAVGVSTRAA
jgi:Uncharacterised nucleotidyltransferase